MFLLEAFFSIHSYKTGSSVRSQLSPHPRSLCWLLIWALYPPLLLRVCAHSLHSTFTICKFLFDCLVCPISPSSLPGPGNQIPCWFCLLLITVLTWWEAWAVQSTHECSTYVCMHGCVRNTATHSPCLPQPFSDCLKSLCIHFSEQISSSWGNFLWNCPISRQMAFLILIAEEILPPSSPLSHFFLWVLFPRLPSILSWNIMFNLNRVRCIGTSHVYILCISHMNLEWILGTLGVGEEWI